MESFFGPRLALRNEAEDSDFIEQVISHISTEDDPVKLVKMVLCWEGVATSAHNCLYSALKKLRSTGWTIFKQSQRPEDRAKRELLLRLMAMEYPAASPTSITQYAINFASICRCQIENLHKLRGQESQVLEARKLPINHTYIYTYIYTYI